MRRQLCGWIALAFSLSWVTQAQAVGTTGAEFLRTEVPASAAAQAAGAAGSGGSEYLTWNPAGIQGQLDPGISFTHFSSFADTAYEQLEGLYPGWLEGSWALRLFYASTYNFMEVNEFGEEVGTLDNHDILLNAAYARPLLGQDFILGVGLKLFESALAGFSSQGAAADVGVRWHTPWEPLSFGLAAQNLGAMSAFAEEADPLPAIAILGAAAEAKLMSGHGIKVFVDAVYPLVGDEATTLAMGAEYNVQEMVFLRGGYRFLDELGTISLGAGIRYASIGLDYAYQPFADLGGNHRFTLAYIFNQSDAPDQTVVPAAVVKAPAAQPMLLTDLKNDVSELKALPRKYEGRVAFIPAEEKGATAEWQLLIHDQNQRPVRAFNGKSSFPREIIWDGRDNSGQTLSGDHPYSFRYQNLSAGTDVRHDLPQVAPVLKLQFADNTATEAWAQFAFQTNLQAKNWKINIWDFQNDSNVFSSFQLGDLPQEWTWNGKTLEGQQSDSGRKYTYSVEVTTADGFKTISSGQVQPISARNVDAPEGYAGVLIVGVLFDFNRAELKPEITDKLVMAAKLLERYPNATAVCEGHADEIGSHEYNQGLSAKRAHMAANFIAKQGGVKAGQLSVIGFGKTRPENTLSTDEARAQNRRVEIRLFIPKHQ